MQKEMQLKVLHSQQEKKNIKTFWNPSAHSQSNQNNQLYPIPPHFIPYPKKRPSKIGWKARKDNK